MILICKRYGRAAQPGVFGSALNNFGVEAFLQRFLEMTTPPLEHISGDEIISPFDERFSAFVFKIQANMNKAHRDRIAFMRICSGRFERGREYWHVQADRPVKLSQPQQMMAQEREIVDTAYAGDIIGVFDPESFPLAIRCARRAKNCATPASRPLPRSISLWLSRSIP